MSPGWGGTVAANQSVHDGTGVARSSNHSGDDRSIRRSKSAFAARTSISGLREPSCPHLESHRTVPPVQPCPAPDSRIFLQ
eukprot:4749039-Pyramimonas_sp.AAC.1